MNRRARRTENPLALAVLAWLLTEPMHPYELGRRLQQTGQDRRIKYSRGSLYAVVEQLRKAGLVEARGTDRAGQLPERTTYGITPAGRAEFYNRLRMLLAQPHEEYPHFIIALSFISLLHPNEAVTLLRQRITALTATADTTRNALQSAAADGQLWVFLVEEELALDLLDTEVRFIHGLVERLSQPKYLEAWQHQVGSRA